MVTIEKGVPIPQGRGAGRESRRSILDGMEVGDSFRVERAKHVSWASAANNYGKDGRKYSVKQFGDAYRLWRIA